MIRALLDSDVLLDFFFDRQPYSDNTAIILSLQNYAAENAQLDVIVTRNIKDYKNSKLSIVTPDDFIKMPELSTD